MDPSDRHRLELFHDRCDQAAFASLVKQYLPLVHAVAMRVTSNPTQAQDISQGVFVKLARKPVSDLQSVALPVWLHGEARTQSLGLLRAEQRRRKREQLAANFHVFMSADPFNIPWDRISPLIDEVISQLPTREREVLLARFFEGRSHRDIADRLALTEDASRMRVNRSLEKLRDLLARRGITTTSAALAVALPGHALAATEPAGLAASIAAAAAKSAASSSLTSLFLMTLTKKTTATVAALLILGGLAVVTVYNHPAGTARHHHPDTHEESPLVSASPADSPASATKASQRETEINEGGFDWDAIHAQNAAYARATARDEFEKRFVELVTKLDLTESQQAKLRARMVANLDAFDGNVPVGDYGVFSGKTLAEMVDQMKKEDSVKTDLSLPDLLVGEQVDRYKELRDQEIKNKAAVNALFELSQILSNGGDDLSADAKESIRKVFVTQEEKDATADHGGVRTAVVEAADLISNQQGDGSIEAMDQAASLTALRLAAHRQVDEKVAALQPYLSTAALQAYREAVESRYCFPYLDQIKPQ
jgi:RNA polymerase sigma factor (sigma-70 family)